jgi:hypothetical protein
MSLPCAVRDLWQIASPTRTARQILPGAVAPRRASHPKKPSVYKVLAVRAARARALTPAMKAQHMETLRRYRSHLKEPDSTVDVGQSRALSRMLGLS